MSNNPGFTLVELLVTTTIIAIVSAIGFVSYSKYSLSARDGLRTEDLTLVIGRLKEAKAKSGAYPTPESAITITNGATTLGFQWKLGDTLRTVTLGIAQGSVDPKNGVAYTYVRDRRGTKAQLLGYFETSGNDVNFALAPSAFAASLANRSGTFPVANGDRIGAIIQSSGYAPAEEILSGSLSVWTFKSSAYTSVNSCLQSGLLTLAAASAIETCY